jgi:hypothetical protein
LRLNSETVSSKLENIIKPQIDSLNNKWTETDTTIKQSVLVVIKNSVRNTSKFRKALKQIGIIDKEEVRFLCFVWDIRNAMHNNFVNTEKISYELKDEDTNRKLKYVLEAGQGIQFWDTPKWNIVITEKMAKLMVKVIESLDDLPLEKSNILDL